MGSRNSSYEYGREHLASQMMCERLLQNFKKAITELTENIDTNDFELFSASQLTKDEILAAIRLAIGRHDNLESRTKMGGRKSRIDEICQLLRSEIAFTRRWYDLVDYIYSHFAKSTIMKALSRF
jgi:hypothetical protein